MNLPNGATTRPLDTLEDWDYVLKGRRKEGKTESNSDSMT
jgi:hypothetical protein